LQEFISEAPAEVNWEGLLIMLLTFIAGRSISSTFKAANFNEIETDRQTETERERERETE
jgi:hypothetical protein